MRKHLDPLIVQTPKALSMFGGHPTVGMSEEPYTPVRLVQVGLHNHGAR